MHAPECCRHKALDCGTRFCQRLRIAVFRFFRQYRRHALRSSFLFAACTRNASRRDARTAAGCLAITTIRVPSHLRRSRQGHLARSGGRAPYFRHHRPDILPAQPPTGPVSGGRPGQPSVCFAAARKSATAAGGQRRRRRSSEIADAEARGARGSEYAIPYFVPLFHGVPLFLR